MDPLGQPDIGTGAAARSRYQYCIQTDWPATSEGSVPLAIQAAKSNLRARLGQDLVRLDLSDVCSLGAPLPSG